MTPLTRYQSDLDTQGYIEDSAQGDAVEKLERLYHEVLRFDAKERTWWRKWLRRPSAPPKGLYFWGGVGRGKTYLMDLFYETLPIERKMRVHFHRFMRRVHNELTALKGTQDPLERVADRLAAEAQVICFDEFFVVDITDAMLLGTLLEALFKRRVIFVATSNIDPDGLYRDGLQRARFLPAIALLKANTEVVNVDGGVDYRLRTLKQVALYYIEKDEKADAERLSACFASLVPDKALIEEGGHLRIEGRAIPVVRMAEDIVWFDFSDICEGPRSQRDYIEIAREFHAVIVASVPGLGGANDDAARRFIYMVDEFYDRNVKLILSASVPISELYGGERLGFEFERTGSRLLEMQSEDYLARGHRP